MKIFILFFVALAIVLFACSTSSNQNGIGTAGMADETMTTAVVTIDTVSENYLLLKQQCLVCHGGAPTHEELIAPPMVAVKRRYMMRYNNQAEFEKAMLAWALNPSKEKALMRGAVGEFNLMPKPATKEEDLKKIVKFIYENELEQPEWFEEHYQQMHGKGMGMKVN